MFVSGNLKELEHLSDRPSSAELAPTAVAVTPSVSVEKVESIARTVQELTSGAELALKRQGTFENRCACTRTYVYFRSVC